MKKNLLLYAFLSILTSFAVYLTINLKDVGYFLLENNQRITTYYHDKIYLSYIASAALVIVGYFGMSKFVSHQKETHKFYLSTKWGTVIYSLIIISLVISSITLAYSPDTPLTNLVKKYVFNIQSSTTNHLELRLAMQNLPTLLQFLFEFERRILMPFLLIEVFCETQRNRLPMLFKLLLIFVASFNVLLTVDRAIGATYLFTVIASLLYKKGTSFFRNKKFWALLLLLLANVVILKHFQYGEFWSHEKMRNLDWHVVHLGEKNIKSPIDRRIPSSGDEFRINSLPTEKGNVISNGICSSYATIRASSSEKNNTSSSTKISNKPVFRYYCFAVSSLMERIFLSPLQMLSYSFHEFNDKNFLNFQYIRILSYVGLTKFVKPTQLDDKKYNKSFPLGYIGDLWRNGGWSYIIIYSFCLGIIMSVIDRWGCCNSFISPKILGLVGTISLFYSNAFSATSICLIAASFLLSIICISAK